MVIRKFAATAVALMVMSASAVVQAQTQAGAADSDGMASEAEQRQVMETLSKIGCQADEVEKENSNLFEIDDARCEIGQYDIKLNGQYQIISMTRD